MKKLLSVLGLAVALGVVGRMPAAAQGDADLARNWDVRIGFFVPERNATRAAEGDVWFSIGAEKEISQMSRGNTSISVDYYGAGRRYNVPIQFNLRGMSHKFRVGVGAGIAIGNDGNNGETMFAYNLLLGYQLRGGDKPMNADIRYLGTGKRGGLLNGWAFTLSTRF